MRFRVGLFFSEWICLVCMRVFPACVYAFLCMPGAHLTALETSPGSAGVMSDGEPPRGSSASLQEQGHPQRVRLLSVIYIKVLDQYVLKLTDLKEDQRRFRALNV